MLTWAKENFRSVHIDSGNIFRPTKDKQENSNSNKKFTTEVILKPL